MLEFLFILASKSDSVNKSMQFCLWQTFSLLLLYNIHLKHAHNRKYIQKIHHCQTIDFAEF